MGAVCGVPREANVMMMMNNNTVPLLVRVRVLTNILIVVWIVTTDSLGCRSYSSIILSCHDSVLYFGSEIVVVGPY